MPLGSHNLLHIAGALPHPCGPMDRGRLLWEESQYLCVFPVFLYGRRARRHRGAGLVFSPAQQVKTFIIVDAARRPASFSVITGYERRRRCARSVDIKGESDDLDARSLEKLHKVNYYVPHVHLMRIREGRIGTISRIDVLPPFFILRRRQRADG